MIGRALLVELVAVLRAEPELAAELRALLVPERSAELLSLRDVHEATGLTVRALRGAIRREELPATLVGRELRVSRSALSAWLERPRAPKTREPAKTPAQRAIERARNEGSLRVVGGRG